MVTKIQSSMTHHNGSQLAAFSQLDFQSPLSQQQFTHNLEPLRFDTWMDSKLKLDALFEINKSSDLTDDWQWLQDSVFEFQPYYKSQTIDYVCQLFK